MKSIVLAAIVTLSTFTFANAQPPAGVQRQRSRSATVNRVRPQADGVNRVDRVTRPPRLPNTVPPTTPNPNPTPTPGPGPRPPRPAPNVIIRPRPIVINPGFRAPLRSPVRYRTVIRNGRSVQVPYYTDVQESFTQSYVAPQQRSSVQYSTSDLLEQLRAENQALREENAYLKGQLNAVK